MKQMTTMTSQSWLTSEYPPVTDELLSEIVRRIRYVGSPLKIVLFGSRARGTAHQYSDIDLLIIENRGSDLVALKLAYYRALAGLFPEFNVLIFSTRDLAEWRNVSNHLITEALRCGRVLFDDTSSAVLETGVGVAESSAGGELWVCEDVAPKTQSDYAMEWFSRADDDLATGTMVASQRVRLVHACFFTQQAIEKYFKGLLIVHGRTFPRTHDLEELYRECSALADLSELAETNLKTISDYYITTRYTSYTPSQAEADAGLELAMRVRSAVIAAVPPEARPLDDSR